MGASIFHSDNISLNSRELKSWYSEKLQITVEEEADMIIASTSRYAYKFVDDNGNVIKWQVLEEGFNAAGLDVYEKLIYEGLTKPDWIPDAIILE